MTGSFIDRWSPGPALRGFTARHEDSLEEPTLVICLPLVEHTVGAQTNNYFECILIGLCHRTTHNPEVSLSLSLFKVSGWGKDAKHKSDFVGTNKTKASLVFPTAEKSPEKEGGLRTKL